MYFIFNLKRRKISTILIQYALYKISMKGAFNVKIFSWGSGL
jgi:hypothetical protein